MNACISQIISQNLLIYIQSKQDIPMLEKNNNILKYFKPYKDEKYILDE